MSALTRRSALAGALGLAACASLRDPVPGRYRIAGTFEVTLERVWSDFTSEEARSQRLISLNGPTIDRLYLAALKTDEGLHRRVKAASRTRALSVDDATDFVAKSVEALGYAKPVITRAATHPFGGAPGVRVALATSTGDGLLIDGEARLAAHAGRLCVILHLAAREHYFAATTPAAQATMESVRLL